MKYKLKCLKCGDIFEPYKDSTKWNTCSCTQVLSKMEDYKLLTSSLYGPKSYEIIKEEENG